ncbi:histamine H2 receptor-like, partial [Paramuricea clavata]
MEENITRVSNGSGSLCNPLTTGAILFSTQVSFSLMANFLVVFLFACRRHLLCNPHNRCILSLSITDILTSISVFTSPNFVLGENVYHPKGHNYLTRELYCRILWSNFLPFALGVTSLYTSVVLSFERWLAVRRSIFYKRRFKIRHMNVLIMASWITGFAAEVLVTIFVEGVYDKPTEICRPILVQNKISTICLSTGLFLFVIVIPLALIILAYIDVFLGIKTSLRFAASARAENMNNIKRLKKVTKVAAITTFVLAVCWLPSSVLFYYSLL